MKIDTGEGFVDSKQVLQCLAGALGEADMNNRVRLQVRIQLKLHTNSFRRLSPSGSSSPMCIVGTCPYILQGALNAGPNGGACALFRRLCPACLLHNEVGGARVVGEAANAIAVQPEDLFDRQGLTGAGMVVQFVEADDTAARQAILD